ncbi:MAG TPA: hypothetical protein VI391_06500 [Thermoanaerobaculia bacterium]
MQAFGSDRVRKGEGDEIILSCRLSKGWNAGNGKIPGTAVLWEERYFEVVAVDDLKQAGFRYVLAPWEEKHTMRLTDRYDAETEALRLEEYRRNAQREKARASANLLGVFTGNLPAVVQEHLARELGVLAPRLTLMSILGTYLVVAAIVLASVTALMSFKGLSAPLIVIAGYFTVENSIRFLICWTQSRPIGSSIGFIGYMLFHFITGRGPSPFAEEKGQSVRISAAPDHVAREDAFKVREPFVTLLTPAEQSRVAERFNYDYRRESALVAVTILLIAAVGVVSSYVRGAASALIVAGALGAEQIIRLAAFRRGPAASVLRFVVRPLVRKLL